MNPRLKLAARRAVEMAGGVDAAAAATGKAKSTAGRWHALNESDLPTIDSAWALDAVAIAGGAEPPILSAMAREFGLTLVSGGHESASSGDFLTVMAHLIKEGGEVQLALANALSDGAVDKAEANMIRSKIADLVDELRRLDVKLQGVG